MKFSLRRADAQGRMAIGDFQPRVVGENVMSNAERQRQFRKRHPGYYQRLHAERRAARKASFAEYWAKHQLAAEARFLAAQDVPAIAMQDAIAEPMTTPPMLALPAPVKPMLCLPAPMQDPMMEQLIALSRLHKLRKEAEAMVMAGHRHVA